MEELCRLFIREKSQYQSKGINQGNFISLNNALALKSLLMLVDMTYNFYERNY